MRCLRRKDYTSVDVWGKTMDWYSMLCADDLDVPSFQAWEGMKARGEHLQPSPEQQAADAADAAAAAAEQAAAAAAATAAAQQQQQLAANQAAMADPQQVDYWALQQEFYKVGVANAPDPPPKGQPDAHVEYRERFEVPAAEAGQQQPVGAVEQQQEQQQQALAPLEQQQQWQEAPAGQPVQEWQQAPTPEVQQQWQEAPALQQPEPQAAVTQL